MIGKKDSNRFMIDQNRKYSLYWETSYMKIVEFFFLDKIKTHYNNITRYAKKKSKTRKKREDTSSRQEND